MTDPYAPSRQNSMAGIAYVDKREAECILCGAKWMSPSRTPKSCARCRLAYGWLYVHGWVVVRRVAKEA